MTEEFVSLAVIAAVALICPLIAQSIPRKPIPETVLLIAAGTALGKYGAGIIENTGAVLLLSNLGLAFLFLLAGYEIDPKKLTDSEGKRGLVTWLVTFGIAGLVVLLLPGGFVNTPEGNVALTIMLTTTALGTLMPILSERGLTGTRVGDLVIKFGTWGELCPVLAMALLLSARAKWQTALILLALVALCVLTVLLANWARREGTRIYHFLTENADSNSQTFVRVVVLLLVLLVTFSAVFDLDIVLGAFAAGFVLRIVAPEGTRQMDKLNGMAYGFFIPLFFVISGTKIDISAVGAKPGMLVAFIFLLILVRAVPVYVSLSTSKKIAASVSPRNRLSVALYCTTALPVIVAVASVAQSSGMMSQQVTSVLIAAGAISVLVMPLLAAIAYRIAETEPINAIHEIREGQEPALEVLREHISHHARGVPPQLQQALANMRRQQQVSQAEARDYLRSLAHVKIAGMSAEDQHAMNKALDDQLFATDRVLTAREKRLNREIAVMQQVRARLENLTGASLAQKQQRAQELVKQMDARSSQAGKQGTSDSQSPRPDADGSVPQQSQPHQLHGED